MATATALHPGKLSETVSFRPRYGNYIGGKWVEPASGRYFENVTPVTGKTFCEILAPTRRILSGRWMRRTRHARPGATPAQRIAPTS